MAEPDRGPDELYSPKITNGGLPSEPPFGTIKLFPTYTAWAESTISAAMPVTNATATLRLIPQKIEPVFIVDFRADAFVICRSAFRASNETYWRTNASASLAMD